MECIKKDAMLVLDAGKASAYNKGYSKLELPNDLENDRDEIESDLKKLDVISIDDSSKYTFLDSNGFPVEPREKGFYIRAKYYGEPNVYYEASFDAINRMNRERLMVYKHLAQMLGATMITSISIKQQTRKNRFDFGFGQANQVQMGMAKNRQLGVNVKDVNFSIERNTEFGMENDNAINLNITRMIGERLDEQSIQFAMFETHELTQDGWEDAKKFLLDNNLYYIEDFKNLLNSRNPKYGKKIFDFLQYQTSSDMCSVLNIAASIDMASLAKNSSFSSVNISRFFVGVGSKYLAKLTTNFGINFKRAVHEFQRDSIMFAIGFDGIASGSDYYRQILADYKETNELFGKSESDNNEMAIKLIKADIPTKKIVEITKMDEEEINQLGEKLKEEINNTKSST